MESKHRKLQNMAFLFPRTHLQDNTNMFRFGSELYPTSGGAVRKGLMEASVSGNLAGKRMSPSLDGYSPEPGFTSISLNTGP